MAAPKTSARSHAAIAISQSTHKASQTGFGYDSRQACARSRPATIPKRAAKVCKRIAIRFDSTRTHTRDHSRTGHLLQGRWPSFRESMPYPTLTR